MIGRCFILFALIVTSQCQRQTFEDLICQHCRSRDQLSRYVLSQDRCPQVINETVLREVLRQEIEDALNKRPGIGAPTQSVDEEDGVFLNVSDITDDQGWTTFQRRSSGLTNFYRSWDEYVNGFGYRGGEFWLGLANIHQLTKNGDCELQIVMRAVGGTRYTVNYRNFTVTSANDKYRLVISGHSGSLSDSLRYHNYMQFSTKDADNDYDYLGSCSTKYGGAWWYNECHQVDLNGGYSHTTGWKGLVWRDHENKRTLHMRATTMKLRLKK